ncbi:MAG TPA: mechanosensitive ion channel domain-containing protein [Aquella sp.]|nr:mechanosensitive ion channel domain-containing protein [Aquella sp.]
MLEKFIDSILAPTLNATGWLHVASSVIVLLLLLIGAVITYYLVELIIKLVMVKFVKSRKLAFIKVLSKNKTLHSFAHIAAGVFLWWGSQTVIEHSDTYSNYEAVILGKLALLYIFVMSLVIASRIVWSINTYYEKHFDFARQYPIYSYLRVVILFIWVIGVVLVISFSLQTSPWALLTGIGAISAVFVLVFKDTILGIIASIQATALDIVRIGDRVSLKKYEVDGRVLDISINTVKIKNSDNTVASVPTYMLISEVVHNWRPVEESSSRRIKRAVYLDSDSVTACDAALLEKLQHLAIIKQYMLDNPDTEFINLTLFRVFFQDYLKRHKNINHNELVMVRHLDPLNVGGLPLEVYAYTTTYDLATFEQIQADIFEYLFSMLPIFNLKVYRQN